MFLKAGALSLVLLLLSRVLGLLRESALAAAFGASGVGDVAVLMLTLPDWIAGVLASGALAYVLLPQWAQQTPAQQAVVQRRVAWGLLAGGVIMGLGIVLPLWMGKGALLQLLLPGAATLAGGFSAGAQALVWAACGLPAALLAALWVTRLQHERDVVGMYGANVVVNGCLVLAVMVMGATAGRLGASGSPVSVWPSAVTQLGLALCIALGLRLLWLRWRLERLGRLECVGRVGRGGVLVGLSDPTLSPTVAMPRTSVWVWAALSAGLPLALPFFARSAASGAGEGALAIFNYAWKLVELPLMLAIQLVATLAFPAITRAMAASPVIAVISPEAQIVIRRALALAWVLACAAVAALSVGATAIANLLFGWGRMDAASVAQVADWGRIGAWGLLPQALTAVAVTVLATQGRLRSVAAVYGLAVALAVLAMVTGASIDGGDLMRGLNILSALVALGLLTLLRGSGILPWRAMAVAAGGLAVVQMALFVSASTMPHQKGLFPLVLSGFVAIVIVTACTAVTPDVRQGLRR